MQNTFESPRLRRWVIVGSLTSCVGTSLSIVFIIGILLPEISKELDLSPLAQGWLGSSVLIANLIFCIPVNLVTSRFRPWRTVTLLFLGIVGSALLQSWTPVLAALFVGRVGAGLFFTSTQAPRSLLIQQWIPRHRISFTNGLAFAGIDLIMGIAFLVTPQFQALAGGWRETFFIWSMILLGLTLVWMFVGGERVTEEYAARARAETTSPLNALRNYKQLWIMALGMGGSMAAQAGFQNFWPTMAEENLGFSPGFVGLALGATTFAAAPTDFLVNAVPALIRRRTVVLTVCGIASIVSLTGMVYATSAPLSLALAVLKGFSFAFFPVLMIMVFLIPGIRPREIGIGMSFMETSIWGGSAIGPLLVGGLQQAIGNLQTSLFISGLLPVTLLVSAVLLYIRDRSPAPPPFGAPIEAPTPHVPIAPSPEPTPRISTRKSK